MGGVHGQIVYGLGASGHRDGLDRVAAIRKRHDLVADFEVTGVHPLAGNRIERVLGGCRQRLARNPCPT